jgi:hypothetical protein
MMCAHSARWLAKMGIEVPPGIKVEISPLFALTATDLSIRAVKIPALTKNTYLREDLY